MHSKLAVKLGMSESMENVDLLMRIVSIMEDQLSNFALYVKKDMKFKEGNVLGLFVLIDIIMD